MELYTVPVMPFVYICRFLSCLTLLYIYSHFKFNKLHRRAYADSLTFITPLNPETVLGYVIHNDTWQRFL